MISAQGTKGSMDLGASWGEVHPFLHLKPTPSNGKHKLMAKAQHYF